MEAHPHCSRSQEWLEAWTQVPGGEGIVVKGLQLPYSPDDGLSPAAARQLACRLAPPVGARTRAGEPALGPRSWWPLGRRGCPVVSETSSRLRGWAGRFRGCLAGERLRGRSRGRGRGQEEEHPASVEAAVRVGLGIRAELDAADYPAVAGVVGFVLAAWGLVEGLAGVVGVFGSSSHTTFASWVRSLSVSGEPVAAPLLRRRAPGGGWCLRGVSVPCDGAGQSCSWPRGLRLLDAGRGSDPGWKW